MTTQFARIRSGGMGLVMVQKCATARAYEGNMEQSVQMTSSEQRKMSSFRNAACFWPSTGATLAMLGSIALFLPGVQIPIVGTQVVPNQTPHVLLYNYEGKEVATCAFAAGTKTISNCTLLKGITLADCVGMYAVETVK